jgi:uncharacterized protein (DUF1697 family)
VGTWVCLLRGVNVGGHNRVSMPVLREALTAAGFLDVRTYVQSGNVIARSAHRSPTGVADAVNAVIQQGFGLDVPVVVRTPEHLRGVLAWDPFPDVSGSEPKRVAVVHRGFGFGHVDPKPSHRHKPQEPWGFRGFQQSGRQSAVRSSEIAA